MSDNLDMILQLKYMPRVMRPARIASSDWKSYKCYGLCYALSSKRVRWPPISFYGSYLMLSFPTCRQSFKKICTWEDTLHEFHWKWKWQENFSNPFFDDLFIVRASYESMWKAILLSIKSIRRWYTNNSNNGP